DMAVEALEVKLLQESEPLGWSTIQPHSIAFRTLDEVVERAFGLMFSPAASLTFMIFCGVFYAVLSECLVYLSFVTMMKSASGSALGCQFFFQGLPGRFVIARFIPAKSSALFSGPLSFIGATFFKVFIAPLLSVLAHVLSNSLSILRVVLSTLSSFGVSDSL